MISALFLIARIILTTNLKTYEPVTIFEWRMMVFDVIFNIFYIPFKFQKTLKNGCLGYQAPNPHP